MTRWLIRSKQKKWNNFNILGLMNKATKLRKQVAELKETSADD